MVLAGLGAGVSEAILVVTPSETIKTKLIHDQNRPNPRFKGLVHGIKTIVRESGLKGVYQGMPAVVARQGANSAVRMSTYGILKESLAKRYPVDLQTGKTYIPWYMSFISGALAGIITVYSTMPLDVIKTRMQGLDAQMYRHSLHCALEIYRSEGITAFWKGAVPRLGRLIFSGAIVFSVYEQVIWGFDQLNRP